MKIPNTEYKPRVGDRIKYDGTDATLEGVVGEVKSDKYYIHQNQQPGSKGEVDPSVNWYKYSWMVLIGSNLYGAKVEIISSGEVTKTNNTIIMSILKKFKELTRSEPEKSFVKVGVMNDNLDLTDEGTKLFIAFLFEQNKDKFKSEVVDKLLEESKEK